MMIFYAANGALRVQVFLNSFLSLFLQLIQLLTYPHCWSSFLLLWNDNYFLSQFLIAPWRAFNLSDWTRSPQTRNWIFTIGEHCMCTFIHPFSNRRRDWRKSTFSPHFSNMEKRRGEISMESVGIFGDCEECCVCEKILWTNFSQSQCEESNSTLCINFVSNPASYNIHEKVVSLWTIQKKPQIFAHLHVCLIYYAIMCSSLLRKEIRNLQIFHQFEIPRPHLALNSKFSSSSLWRLRSPPYYPELDNMFRLYFFIFFLSLAHISFTFNIYRQVEYEKKTLRKSCSDYAMYVLYVRRLLTQKS